MLVIVIALVGPAGTGKSYRASQLATAYGLDTIIDDGLLIQDDHIIAGVSAKKEETSMAAVRRAIFSDAAHREAVRAALQRQRPDGVLVLGTSVSMVERIVDALDLPRPEKTIAIADIASSEEIHRARQSRRVEGRHVIPAPTVEVKKSFSGYLVDPLRFLRSGSQEQTMEKSLVRPTFSALGRFFISESAIAAIVGQACCNVEGVVDARRVRVDLTNDGVSLSVDLGLRLGSVLPDVLRRAQDETKAMVEHMTALSVLTVDVIARRLVE